MDLEQFIYNLHFDVDQVRPPDFQADWSDAPLAVKLYRNLPVIALSAEVPLALEPVALASRAAVDSDRAVVPQVHLRNLGHFLWYAFGLAQLTQSISPGTAAQNPSFTLASRRYAPSGGALHPNELYLYLRIEDAPVGVYHYDVAHHRLVLLRAGNFDSYLERGLGPGNTLAACFGVVFVSTMFWKNFFKYNLFSYRLQSLDAGVLIGQLLEVAKQFGYAARVNFQFLDDALHHLLGLDAKEESVYAVLPLSVLPPTRVVGRAVAPASRALPTASELCAELSPVKPAHFVQSRTVLPFLPLLAMNEASKLQAFPDSSTSLHREYTGVVNADPSGKNSHATSPLAVAPPGSQPTMALPSVPQSWSVDFASVCRNRYSPGTDFILGKVSQLQLATLLHEAWKCFRYQNDLEGDADAVKWQPRVTLYGCFYGVEGVPDGAYCYDSVHHSLCSVRAGDHRAWLQQGMSMHNVNLYQVPICFHVVGKRDHLRRHLGYRGYRIQQMEAGMLAHRILLVATALGMGGHPLLGFDAVVSDEIYNLDGAEKTSLIQIPVGPHRVRAQLEGGLHG